MEEERFGTPAKMQHTDCVSHLGWRATPAVHCKSPRAPRAHRAHGPEEKGACTCLYITTKT